MLDVICINKGESLHAELEYKDEAGAPINLTGAIMDICEALPIGLTGGTVTIVDGPQGVAHLVIPVHLTALMGAGKVSWLRISMEPGEGTKDVSPKIWVRVE